MDAVAARALASRASAGALRHERCIVAAMMRRRNRFDLAVAFGDLAFAVALFACGLFDAPLWLAGLAAAGMLAYWSWTRRAPLNRLRGAAWASQTGIAISVIIAIEAGAYWLGLGVRENF